MNLKKIIRLFYMLYTIYVILLIGATDLNFFKTIFAVIFMWINYILFSIGYNLPKKSNKYVTENKQNIWLLNCKRWKLLTISVLSIVFSILAVKYYTGQTPVTVFRNLNQNISVYYEYQNYFAENERYLFSIKKIPFILMLFYIKIVLSYSYVSLFLSKETTITKFEKFYLLLVTIAYIYVGIARGTSFEFFELLILILYILLSKYNHKKHETINVKPIILGMVLVATGIFIFVSGTSARGVKYDPYSIRLDVNYDPGNWFSTLSPYMAVVIFRLYAYFGFGFFYVSTYLVDVWFSSLGNFFSGLIPLGYQLYRGQDILEIMKDLANVGVKWQPDVVLAINKFGYLGLLVMCFLLGIVVKNFYIIEEKRPILELTNYIVLLGMISLPIGNFLFTSSATRLVIVTLLIYWLWRVVINIKVRVK